MSNYIKSPRGLNLDQEHLNSDQLLRKAITIIGMNYGTRGLSHYGKGIRYIKGELKCSSNSIKFITKIKTTTNFPTPNYAHYVRLHKGETSKIIGFIVSCLSNCDENLAETIKRYFPTCIFYVDAFMSGTFWGLDFAVYDSENFNSFNRNEDASDIAVRISNEFREIDERII